MELSWGAYLCRGVHSTSRQEKQEINGEHSESEQEKRAKNLVDRLESALKLLGLTPFSARVIIQYISSKLQNGQGEKLRRVIGYLLSLIQHSQHSNLAKSEPYYAHRKGCPQIIPGLRSFNFWNASHFPWIAELESKINEIKQEFLNLRELQQIQTPKDSTVNEDSTEGILSQRSGGFQPYRAPSSEVKIVEKGKWNVCYLLLHGMDFSQNAAKCPITMDLIRHVPRQYNHAFFSALAPNSNIGAHYGPTNKKLRCYFPVFVPSSKGGCCSLTVNGEKCVVEEGRCIIFDDSFLHEAANENIDNPRINLIFDFWHPDLSDEEIKVLDFINKGQQNAAKRLKKCVTDRGTSQNGSSIETASAHSNLLSELEDDFLSIIQKGSEEGVALDDIADIWGSY